MEIELKSSSSTCQISSYGATVISWLIDGCGDVVVGCDGSNGKLDDPQLAGFYFGCIVGRVANRIRLGRFHLPDTETQYQVGPCTNGNGNHLHGGGAFSFVNWEVRRQDSHMVSLERVSPHSENGYPAAVKFQVTYELTGNELSISYNVQHLDGPCTVVNPTSHLYFNLNPSRPNSSILNHTFHTQASSYLETDNDLLPTGRIIPLCDNVALDFHSSAKPIGRDIAMLRHLPHKGYDHYYIMSDVASEELREVCSLTSAESKLRLTVKTTAPGFQIYTANYFSSIKAKESHSETGWIEYGENAAIAIETHAFPDAVNWPEWQNTVLLRPGETFQSRTIYSISNLK